MSQVFINVLLTKALEAHTLIQSFDYWTPEQCFFPVVHTHTAGFPVDMSMLVIGQKLQTHAPSCESACS